jgi:SDR family mycofactocin-dependent oxidoreductase
MANSLAGKVAVITGGARGQGRSHALALARAGADIALLDRVADINSVPYHLSTPEDLAHTQKLVEGFDRRCMTITADVRDGAGLKQAVNDVVTELGHVDIALANAGILSWSSVEEMCDETWQDMIDINLGGAFNVFRAVAPHLREQRSGRVVATASMAGRGGFAQISHYAAAKWGLIGLTKSFALEMAPYGVTANVVAPTNVNTGMIQNEPAWKFFTHGVENPTKEDVAARFSAMTGMGIPWVEPSDISNGILYLVSEGARYVTGEVLHVAAGMNAFNAV